MKKLFHIYDGRVGFRMGKLLLMVSEVNKSLASIRTKFLVRKSDQRSSSERMILAFSLTAENSWLEFRINL